MHCNWHNLARILSTSDCSPSAFNNFDTRNFYCPSAINFSETVTKLPYWHSPSRRLCSFMMRATCVESPTGSLLPILKASLTPMQQRIHFLSATREECRFNSKRRNRLRLASRYCGGTMREKHLRPRAAPNCSAHCP